LRPRPDVAHDESPDDELAFEERVRLQFHAHDTRLDQIAVPVERIGDDEAAQLH
jgi:hypothetical protein